MLVTHLDELRELTGELRDELPHVNDAHLRPTVTLLVETAQVVWDGRGDDPKPSIADDLAVLMSAVRARCAFRRVILIWVERPHWTGYGKARD